MDVWKQQRPAQVVIILTKKIVFDFWHNRKIVVTAQLTWQQNILYVLGMNNVWLHVNFSLNKGFMKIANTQLFHKRNCMKTIQSFHNKSLIFTHTYLILDKRFWYWWKGLCVYCCRELKHKEIPYNLPLVSMWKHTFYTLLPKQVIKLNLLKCNVL